MEERIFRAPHTVPCLLALPHSFDEPPRGFHAHSGLRVIGFRFEDDFYSWAALDTQVSFVYLQF